jgi:hypothetical protein
MTSTFIESEPAHAGVTPRRNVLFVHIQKTAGMSLYNGMAKWFGNENSLRYPRSSSEFEQQFLRLSDAEIGRFRLLSGHFDLPFWLQRELGDRLVVSVVREPVDRILSIYRYAKSWNQHRLHATVGQMNVAEYVDYHVNDRSRHNWQCRKLSGTDDFRAARDMAQTHVDLLGAVELMGMLTKALGDRLGVPLDIGVDNRSQDPHPRRDDLDSALLAKLQSCNAEDYKLWAHVIEKNLACGHR